jgi:class 3 adenylate cyclase
MLVSALALTGPPPSISECLRWPARDRRTSHTRGPSALCRRTSPGPTETDVILGEIEQLLTGSPAAANPDRVLATVLFTDIAGSTRRAAEVGDATWRRLLEQHDELVRSEVFRAGGRLVKPLGDGTLAVFAGPARAISCAQTLVDGVADLGMSLRAGVHTGECETRGDDLGGMAVHIGARVGALAEPGEILVTKTVVDLVVGSGLQFSDRGNHQLRAFPAPGGCLR